LFLAALNESRASKATLLKRKEARLCLTSTSIFPLEDWGGEETKYAGTQQLGLTRGNKVIAKLDNCNYNKSRHGWSKQKIHRSSFPRKVGEPLKFGPA
jgi:hypothetical protein